MKAYTTEPSDRRTESVEDLAYQLACDRGGQTMPLCSYDLDRAEEIITGQDSLRAENDRLRKRIAELEKELHS